MKWSLSGSLLYIRNAIFQRPISCYVDIVAWPLSGDHHVVYSQLRNILSKVESI